MLLGRDVIVRAARCEEKFPGTHTPGMSGIWKRTKEFAFKKDISTSRGNRGNNPWQEASRQWAK
jgi:hypothetical protein